MQKNSTKIVDIIDGHLAAEVHQHLYPHPEAPFACLTFLSLGLETVGHPEIAITLKMAHPEQEKDIPLEPLQLFGAIFQYAQQGSIAEVGGVTRMATGSFFGFSGLVYVERLPVSGIEIPENGLTAIGLTEDEFEAYEAFGFARVLARLGHQTTSFPYPVWLDAERPSLDFKTTYEHSMLMKLPRIPLPGLFVNLEERRTIRLRVPKEMYGPAGIDLPDLQNEEMIALLPGWDREADAFFVWEPGQDRPNVIGPEGSAVSLAGGAMLNLVQHPEGHSESIALEDGFALIFNSEQWTQLWDAFAKTEDLRLEFAEGDFDFHLHWF